MDAYNHARAHGSAVLREELRRAIAREALARIAADAGRYPNDPEGYAERVRQLEAEGLDTSDAQGIADMEQASGDLAQWVEAIRGAA